MKKVINIGFVFVAHHRHLYEELAVAMKEEIPYRKFYMYVADDTQKEYVETNYKHGLIQDILHYPRFANDFDSFANVTEESKLCEINRFERQFGLSANALLVVDRHFGRGYSPGGYFHPKSSRIANYGYADAVYSHVNCLNFFAEQINLRQLDLIIGGNTLVMKACELRGIPYRNLVSARVENRYAWSVDQYWSNPLIKIEFEKIENKPITSDVDLVRYYESQVFRTRHLERQDQLSWLIKTMFVIVGRQLKNMFRSGRKPGQYLLIEQLKFVIRRYLGRRQLTGSKFCLPLSKLPDNFIYYPLQTEPEATLQAFSPEFFFQHTLVIMLAKAAPFSMPVLVKETFLAAGRRPSNFYDQILDLLNVSFIDMSVEGIDVIKKSKIVCTISGSAGIEAALLGKPILNFGQHNCYEFLDHSINIRAFEDVEKGIEKANEVDEKKAKQDGLKFRHALRNSTVDMGAYSSSTPEKIDQKVISDCLQLLWRSLSKKNDRESR